MYLELRDSVLCGSTDGGPTSVNLTAIPYISSYLVATDVHVCRGLLPGSVD